MSQVPSLRVPDENVRDLVVAPRWVAPVPETREGNPIAVRRPAGRIVLVRVGHPEAVPAWACGADSSIARNRAVGAVVDREGQERRGGPDAFAARGAAGNENRSGHQKRERVTHATNVVDSC